MLSRQAQEFAREISKHDWSDAPYRADRAGHDRESDHTTASQLTPEETDRVKLNVMWVTAQVLMHEDPNLQILEYAQACGLPRNITHNKDGRVSGALMAGIRFDHDSEMVASPGSWKREG